MSKVSVSNTFDSVRRRTGKNMVPKINETYQVSASNSPLNSISNDQENIRTNTSYKRSHAFDSREEQAKDDSVLKIETEFTEINSEENGHIPVIKKNNVKSNHITHHLHTSDKEYSDESDINEMSEFPDTFLIPDDDKTLEIDHDISKENSIMIALQVFFPFLIAGFGTVFAGLLLDVVQHWEVYIDIPEVYILVPALLGLKGNLEMTLASRLSTAANVGHMSTSSERKKIIIGNMVLTQAQALVVAALASIAAVVFRWIPSDSFDINHAFLLCASSLITASLASAILGSIMVVVILLSKKYGINPDNVATPIAASLGDLVTLALLSYICNFLYKKIELDAKYHWIAPFICVLCLVLLPLWFYLAHHNKYTNSTLYNGWVPVISAMCISSGGGLILSYFVRQYSGMAVFSPVINGVGGNLVAVQASRLATALHMKVSLGTLPPSTKYGCITTFCTAGGHSRTARVLIFMSIPGHIIFLAIISNLKAGHTSTTARFVFIYLLAGFIQVAILLFICNWLVHWLWKKRKDPDNYSIPYLTALGDLLGTALLAGAFQLLYMIGDRDADVGD